MRIAPLSRALLAATLVSALSLGAVHAATVRIANQGDALSMDPHSLNESLQLSVTNNVYESLVGVSKDLKFEPALATSWKQTSPTVWRFELRKNVRFHDDTPFTADDVVFSLARAAGEGSDMRSNTNDIKEVRKLGSHTIEIETKSPFPILPNVLSTVFIMSKKWCEDNQATRPVDRRRGIENAASFRANGTGPYRLRERQPNVRTTFVRNGNYWGKIDSNVTEVIFFGDLQRPDPRGRLAVGRDRHHGAGACTGRAAHQHQPQHPRLGGARAAHHLFGHGPAARRAAVFEREGQKPLQGQARAPGLLPSD